MSFGTRTFNKYRRLRKTSLAGPFFHEVSNMFQPSKPFGPPIGRWRFAPPSDRRRTQDVMSFTSLLGGCGTPSTWSMAQSVLAHMQSEALRSSEKPAVRAGVWSHARPTRRETGRKQGGAGRFFGVASLCPSAAGGHRGRHRLGQRGGQCECTRRSLGECLEPF